MARKALYPPSVTPGIPKLGEIPRGWTVRRFGELIKKVKRPAKLEDDVEYQLVNAKRSRGGIVEREKLAGRDIRVKTQFFTRAGDFLISRRQIIHGACGLVPERLHGAVVSNEYDTMVMRSPALLPEYLEALSHTPYFQRCCFHSSIGVDVEKMVFKLDEFLRLPMAVPPAPEQRRIVQILSAVDAAIEATQAVIEQTRRVRDGLLQGLLTRGVGPNRKPHSDLRATSIGDIPSGWEVRSVGELFDTQLGKMMSKAARSGPNQERYLRNINVRWRQFDLSGLDTIHFSSGEMSKFALRDGDILMCEGRALGRCAIWRSPMRDVYYQKALHRLRSRQGKMLPEFMVNYAYFAFEIADIFRGDRLESTIPHLTKERLEKLLVPVPPLSEQRHIVERLEAWWAGLHAAERYAAQLQQTKAGLLQDLLTGKVRVTV